MDERVYIEVKLLGSANEVKVRQHMPCSVETAVSTHEAVLARFCRISKNVAQLTILVR